MIPFHFPRFAAVEKIESCLLASCLGQQRGDRRGTAFLVAQDKNGRSMHGCQALPDPVADRSVWTSDKFGQF